MSTDAFVIRTKLVPPVRQADVVARERLLSRLGENADRGLALVKAAAGYGKTTLLGQWFAGLNTSTEIAAWYSLDDADNDLARFFMYLVAAVRLRLPAFGESVVEQLTVGVRPSSTSLAAAFVNQIDAIDTRVHVVLDDFHFIDDPDVLEAMCQIVLNAPSNLHLVIATRESPRLPLGRLRALGRFIEIDGEDLRFRGPETGMFMSLAGQTKLLPEEIHALERKTEGWAAGLQLAAISLASRSETRQFIAAFSGSNQDVADFLTEDVMQRLDAETRAFLLETSILDRLTPGLCDAVTGKANGRATLNRLEERSLFLFSLDCEREWYRYHHLFAEYLRRRQRLSDAAGLRRAHRRASQWLGEHGYFEEAIAHALHGRDMARAASFLNEISTALFYSGRLGALGEWFHQIPRMHLRRFPRIMLDQSWAMILEWQFEPARRILDDVRQLIHGPTHETAPGEGPRLLPAILEHREMMYALFRDEMGTVDELCNEMVDDFPVDDPYLRGSLYTCLLYAQREMFDFESIEHHDARARCLYEESGSRFVFIWHDSIVGPTELARGRLDRAEASLAQARSIASDISGERSPLAAMPGLLLAEVFYERNQLDAAQWLIDQYLPVASQIGFVDQLIGGFVSKARLLHAAGEHAAAARTLDDAETLFFKQGFERLAVHVAAERVRQALVAGDLDAVEALGQRHFAQTRAGDMMPAKGVTTRHAIMAVTWHRLACVNGHLDDALALSGKWARFARKRGARRLAAAFEILLAYSHHRRGEERLAVRTLRNAVALAREAGFVRTLLDAPELTPALLGRVAEPEGSECDPISRYASGLAALTGPREDTGDVAPAANAALEAGCIEPLSEREQQILQLVANGLRNREIGDVLGMTEGTVKWHLQHVFNKIGTRRRTQAVGRARELGLLA